MLPEMDRPASNSRSAARMRSTALAAAGTAPAVPHEPAVRCCGATLVSPIASSSPADRARAPRSGHWRSTFGCPGPFHARKRRSANGRRHRRAAWRSPEPSSRDRPRTPCPSRPGCHRPAASTQAAQSGATSRTSRAFLDALLEEARRIGVAGERIGAPVIGEPNSTGSRPSSSASSSTALRTRSRMGAGAGSAYGPDSAGRCECWRPCRGNSRCRRDGLSPRDTTAGNWPCCDCSCSAW